MPDEHRPTSSPGEASRCCRCASTEPSSGVPDHLGDHVGDVVTDGGRFGEGQRRLVGELVENAITGTERRASWNSTIA